MVRPTGIEPVHLAPEASALSPELRAQDCISILQYSIHFGNTKIKPTLLDDRKAETYFGVNAINSSTIFICPSVTGLTS
jgi:hypothetical protein